MIVGSKDRNQSGNDEIRNQNDEKTSKQTQQENDVGELGLGLPNIFFSAVKEPWWNGRVTSINLCVSVSLW